MKIYNAGVRSIYFYLAYIARLSFSNPIYKNYPRIYDLPLVFKKNQAIFGYLYNPRTIHKFLQAYLKKPKLFSGLLFDVKREKRITFKKYNWSLIPKDLNKLSSHQLFSTYTDFFILLRCLFYLNQVIWTLDISGSIFLKKVEKFSSGECFFINPTR